MSAWVWGNVKREEEKKEEGERREDGEREAGLGDSPSFFKVAAESLSGLSVAALSGLSKPKRLPPAEREEGTRLNLCLSSDVDTAW